MRLNTTTTAVQLDNLERARAKELGLDTEFIGCKDCTHSISTGFHKLMCGCPQLEKFTEGTVSLLEINAVRNLSGLCGRRAVWFAKRGPKG